ncbi:MAG: HemK2/MTQ2 family protein methyltransferase [Candidatus Micrarchaeia archaeon]
MWIYESIQIKNCDGVYEPREDSFMLSRAVEKYAFGLTLDLGTGSGIQGLVAAKKGCTVDFVDIDPKALKCAEYNAKINNVKGNFIRSDLFPKGRKYNTIIFNPPYLPSTELSKIYKRDFMLDGGIDGREIINKFLNTYKEHVLDKFVVLLVESSYNKYEEDIKNYKAEIVEKEHYFFEDLVVLKIQ